MEIFYYSQSGLRDSGWKKPSLQIGSVIVVRTSWWVNKRYQSIRKANLIEDNDWEPRTVDLCENDMQVAVLSNKLYGFRVKKLNHETIN